MFNPILDSDFAAMHRGELCREAEAHRLAKRSRHSRSKARNRFLPTIMAVLAALGL